MKHIKPYQIFENIDTIIDDFRDILLELSDDQFNIQVKKGNHHAYSKKIEVIISKDGGPFDRNGRFDFWTKRNIGELTPFMFGEVKEYLLRILSYARSEGWNDFNFDIVTVEKLQSRSESFYDAYKTTVKIKDDEIVHGYYSLKGDGFNTPIEDDVSTLCVYIGLGK